MRVNSRVAGKSGECPKELLETCRLRAGETWPPPNSRQHSARERKEAFRVFELIKLHGVKYMDRDPLTAE